MVVVDVADDVMSCSSGDQPPLVPWERRVTLRDAEDSLNLNPFDVATPQ